MLPIMTVLTVARMPPHIVFIVSDDLGFNDVSFHGSKQVETPHIDAIAERGLVLMNYHVQPVCSPTRSTFMSGRHVIHTGIYMPFSQGGALRLQLNVTLLPQYLKKCCGYSTHMVGKWHLGQNVMKALPIGRGFDSYLGYWSGAEDYYQHDTKGSYDFNDDRAPERLHVATEFNNTYSTPIFTARAVEIITSFSGESASPMFLYLPYQNVHWPLEAPTEYIEMYRNTTGGSHERNMVCAMIKILDDGVGNVTSALRSAGIYNNTVVIFSSDNGGPTNGNEGTWSSNFPMRGGKNTLWEGGTRVVGAIAGPGVRPGITYQKHHATDWLPTLVSMASGRPWTDFVPETEPAYQIGDGLNNWPLMSGGDSARDWLLYEAHPIDEISENSNFHGNAMVLGDMKIIRTGTVNPHDENGHFPPPGQDPASTSYLIMANGRCGDRPPRVGPANGTECSSEYCLFNITADPCEYHNLADEFPGIVRNLVQYIRRFQNTAVPVVENEGCEPVRLQLPGGGSAWQPCDAPLGATTGDEQYLSRIY